MDDAAKYVREGTSAVGDPYADRTIVNSFVRRLIPHVAVVSLTIGGCTETSESGQPWTLSDTGRQAADGEVEPDPDTGVEPEPDTGVVPIPDARPEPDSRVVPPPDSDDNWNPDGGVEPTPDGEDLADPLEEAVRNACSKAKDCDPGVFEEKFDSVDECVDELQTQIPYALQDLERVYGATCAGVTAEWLQCHFNSVTCDGRKDPYLEPYIGYSAADVFQGVGTTGTCPEQRPQSFSSDC
ncbi:MAG: hypothetical protein ABEN55_19915 [Bradymonadaceae bacterium]